MLFIDRSGWETYWQRCPFRYWLERHAGPTRHGIVPVHVEIPLVTGTLVHEPIQAMNDWWMKQAAGAHTQAGLEETARAALQRARKTYLATVAERTFDRTQGLTKEQAFLLGLPAPDARISDEYRAEEQASLLEGFGWIYADFILPDLMKRGRPVWIEREGALLLPGTCTCGLEHTHDWRQHGVWTDDGFQTTCRAIFLLATPDLIIETYDTGELEYHEIKTQASEGRVEQWQYKPQLLAGALCCEPELMKRIERFYVHQFIKGELRGEYNAEQGDYSGPKRQGSPLCYLYRKPPVPGVDVGDWQPKYEWRTEDGYKKRLGKAYSKEPVWTQRFPMQAEWQTATEYWVRVLPTAVLSDCYELVGPLGRQEWMEGDWIRDVRSWAVRVQAAVEETAKGDALSWQSTYRGLIGEVFPQSWDCFPFKEQACPYLGVCTKQAGWQAPWELTTRYTFRLPHHTAERERAVAEGWLQMDDDTGEIS